jgi:ribosomal protein S18 acetylase RimI-like enzyme
MSERTPGSAPRRPATARPRQSRGEDSAPPTREELDAIERQLAELPRYSGATVSDEPELGAVIVGQSGLGPGLNFAACIRWPADRVADRLRALQDRMLERGEWPALVVAEGLTEPGDLSLWLESSGWVALERERAMWTRTPPVVPHLDPALRLEGVTRQTAAEFERVEREVFGLSDSRAAERGEWLMAAVESGQMRAFLVRLRGEVVATTRVALGQHVAGIFGVGVAAPYRRQGYGALVTAIATRSGLASGNRMVWLSVDEHNVPAINLYRSLGFRPSFSWTRWIGSATSR